MRQGQHRVWSVNIPSASILILFLDAEASQGYERMLSSQARMKGEKRTQRKILKIRDESQQNLWIWGSPGCVLEGQRHAGDGKSGVPLGGGLELKAE